MSLHIGAQKGEISEKILLPGDPLRAKWVAENYLEGAKQYNSIRNMFGYTGIYRGERISVQGTGMGLPSLSIYVTELFNEHGVESAIRIGTCGAIQEKTKVGDLILAMTASTDSNINRRFTNGLDFAPHADFGLLLAAYEASFWHGKLVDDPSPLYVNGAYDNGSAIADDSDEGYGYGWTVTKGEQDYATHTGSWMGTSTLYARNLTTGVTVILLANGEAADLWEVQGDIEAAVAN